MRHAAPLQITLCVAGRVRDLKLVIDVCVLTTDQDTVGIDMRVLPHETRV